MTLCRFSYDNKIHTEPAVVRVRLTKGCVCFPDDKEQDLCEAHLIKLENGCLEQYEIIKEY